MSPRVTRSSARQAASQAAQPAGSLAHSSPGATPASAPTTTASASQPDRKRKPSTTSTHEKPPSSLTSTNPTISGRRSKRQKTAEQPLPTLSGTRRKDKTPTDMDGNEYVLISQPIHSLHQNLPYYLSCICGTCLQRILLWSLTRHLGSTVPRPRRLIPGMLLLNLSPRAESLAAAKNPPLHLPLPQEDRDGMKAVFFIKILP